MTRRARGSGLWATEDRDDVFRNLFFSARFQLNYMVLLGVAGLVTLGGTLAEGPCDL